MCCKFCGYLDNKHGVDCCRDLPDAEAQYDAGYLDGRAYAPHGSDHPAYLAGRKRGEIAAETAANVHWSDYYDLDDE
jgi:hypothetical protein